MKNLLLILLLGVCFVGCSNYTATDYIIVSQVHQLPDKTYVVFFQGGGAFKLSTKDEYHVGDTLFIMNKFK